MFIISIFNNKLFFFKKNSKKIKKIQKKKNARPDLKRPKNGFWAFMM